MNASKVFLIPAAAVIAETKQQSDPIDKAKKLCRPSELPIYTPDSTSCKSATTKAQLDDTPSVIESAFSTVRRNVTRVYGEMQAYKTVGSQYVEESKENVEWLLQYLRQEDNTTPKAGAIAVGGLTGFIFGLRGGLIRRTVYAATGALGMASICYPKEAAEYSQIGIGEARKYATIAYNFAYGVNKDDEPLELPSLPTLPTSFTEAWDSVSKSATSLVSGGEAAAVQLDNKTAKTESGDKK